MTILSELRKALKEKIYVDLFLDNQIPYNNVLIIRTNQQNTVFTTVVQDNKNSKIYKYIVKTNIIKGVGYCISSVESDDDNLDDENDIYIGFI